MDSASPQDWARDRLAVRDLILVRTRPWADVWRVDTPDGRWWLKINRAGTTYEPRLLGELAGLSDLLPECVVHPDQPWSLLADAGVPLGELSPALDRDAQLDIWCGLLAGYAELQRVCSSRSLLDTGLPDFSPDRLLERFDEVLADEVWYSGEPAPDYTPEVLDRVRRTRPALERAARGLAGGRPPSVQHDDLHQLNVLATPGVDGPSVRIIDWGDAVWAHPFGTMLVTLASLAAGWELDVADPVLHRVRDAYLEPWRQGGESARALLDELDLAVRTAGLTRAAGWVRALGTPAAGLELGMADGPSAWMLSLADALAPPPFDERPLR